MDVRTLKPEPETNSLPLATQPRKLEETDRGSRGGCLQRVADTWTSYSVIRMKVTDQEIEQIVGYIRCHGWFRQRPPSRCLEVARCATTLRGHPPQSAGKPFFTPIL